MRSLPKVLLCLLFALLLCSASAWGKQLQVVATFSILQDFVEQVGGELVKVNTLIPRGADPHSWEPTPREARVLAQADLVVANGAGFDDWLLPMVKSAAGPNVPLILASQGLKVLDSGHEHHGHHGGEAHAGDPHLWLSVSHAIAYVEKITAALVELAPTQEAYFQERSRAYIEKLWELDERILNELEIIPRENRIIVTYHNAFSYFAERYQFSVAEFLVNNPEAEPSPRDLTRLVQLLAGQAKPALFTEPQLSAGKRYLETLAGEVGAEVYTLYSDSLTPEVPTYFALMEHNLQTLLEALQP